MTISLDSREEAHLLSSGATIGEKSRTHVSMSRELHSLNWSSTPLELYGPPAPFQSEPLLHSKSEEQDNRRENRRHLRMKGQGGRKSSNDVMAPLPQAHPH